MPWKFVAVLILLWRLLQLDRCVEQVFAARGTSLGTTLPGMVDHHDRMTGVSDANKPVKEGVQGRVVVFVDSTTKRREIVQNDQFGTSSANLQLTQQFVHALTV